MKIFITSLLIIIALFSSSYSQTRNNGDTVSRIKNYLSEIDKIGFSGSLLIELNGEKIISKGFGYRNIERKLLNTPNTIFDIGSLTKQFTSAAILKLEMQGKLSTTNCITKYFDNVPEDKVNITIHDLLRHQSGLQSSIGGDYEPITKEEFISKVMNSQLRFEAGKNFSYSNIGYSLLAIIIEKVSGKSYEEFLYENLWHPAGMESTGYSRPNFDSNTIATGYTSKDEPWGKPTDKPWNGDSPFWHLKGNGGILSTTEDLFKWHKALMTENILSNEAKQKLYHPELREGETNNPYYAYGWDVFQTERNTLRIWHNGTNNIFYSDFMRFIDENTVLIMLSNKTHPNFDRMNFEIAKIIFNKDYEPTIPIADNETNRKFTQDVIDDLIEKGLNAGIEKFKNKANNTYVLEYKINEKGYDLLSQKKYDEAIRLFAMNVYAFPKSANAYDSLGEGYLVKGDKKLAIENYKMSLELDPDNENAKEILKQLAE